MLKDKNTIIEHHIDISDEIIEQKINVLELLANSVELSKQQLKNAMAKGSVWLSETADSKKARPIRRKNTKLKSGNRIHLYFNNQVLSQVPCRPTLVKDEKDYSIWNKPYGVWSQGSKWGDHCSIGRLVEAEFNFERQTFVVHRLDRAASGLIIIAHHKKAAQKLSELFSRNQLEKVYQARVKGKFQSEELIIKEPVDDKAATSIVNRLNYDDEKDISLLEVKIETGRKHQIRKHLVWAGFPIIGDRLYGDDKDPHDDLQLSAVGLKFICPLSEQDRQYWLMNDTQEHGQAASEN